MMLLTTVNTVKSVRSNSRWTSERGFTLVEMLVVVTIIGVIMSLVGPRVLNYLGESKVKAAKIQIQSFASALDLFYLDTGRYPTTAGDGKGTTTRSRFSRTINISRRGSVIRCSFSSYFYAGGLMVLFGLFMALNGPSYRLGTLMHMGPGFMPTVLGVILTFLGVLIAAAAIGSPDVTGEERVLPEHPQWWGWFCILAGPGLFIICGSYGGLIPGTFACVFVSAFGDRTTTWKEALILAAVVTLLGVVIFSYLLQVPMPLLAWRG